MSRRAFRAGLCALAAALFLLAAFLPWFESRRPAAPDDEDAARASYQLQGGERCERGRCKPVAYTGARGTRDDLFALLGWATLAGALGTVALTLATAGARRRHRPLRAWAATSAAISAGLGATFVASEIISRHDDVSRSWGLVVIVAGAIIAGVGLALPEAAGAPDRRPERRWGPAVALAAGSVIAWISLADHGWWQGVGAFRTIAASPLGREVCDGDDCQSGALSGGGDGFALLARLSVALIAALLVPAMGAAARAAQARAPGAWGVSAVALALAALVAGAGAALLAPAGAASSVDWGVPGAAVALLAVTAGALLARRWVTSVERDDADLPAPVSARAAVALRGGLPSAAQGGLPPSGSRAGVPEVAHGGQPSAASRGGLPSANPGGRLAGVDVAPGARPVLPSLSPPPPSATPASPAPPDTTYAAYARYLPPQPAAPEPAPAAIDTPYDDYVTFMPPTLQTPPASPPPAPLGPPAYASFRPPPTSGPTYGTMVPLAAPAAVSPFAPTMPPAAAPPGGTPWPSPAVARWPSAPPAPAHGAAPPWAGAPRDQFAPPRPGASGPPGRGQVAAAPPLARRASPLCPGCKQSTLWHSKRSAWWCSACKRVL